MTTIFTMRPTTLLFSALAAAVLASCGGAKDPKAELAKLQKQQAETQAKIAALETSTKTAAPVQPAVPVTAVAIKPESFTSYLEVQGRVEFDQNATVPARMPGTLTSVRVERGGGREGIAAGRGADRVPRDQLRSAVLIVDGVAMVVFPSRRLRVRRNEVELIGLRRRQNQSLLHEFPQSGRDDGQRSAVGEGQLLQAETIAEDGGAVQQRELFLGQQRKLGDEQLDDARADVRAGKRLQVPGPATTA